MRRHLKELLPQWLINAYLLRRERRALGACEPVKAETRLLRAAAEVGLDGWLAAPDSARAWQAVSAELADLRITESACGVNAGDRRALYHIARAVNARRTLEVGTHIGASTAHLVVAMREATGAGPRELTTVDIHDVNDPATRPWRGFGALCSPRECVERLGAGSWVRFVTSPSLDFLSEATGPYDLIFLDGDHAASTVYAELPLAAELLAPGGLIVLHDVFPRNRPLWDDRVVIPGPWLAIERLRQTAPDLVVRPLGALPWATKQGSCMTSLAIVCRAGGE